MHIFRRLAYILIIVGSTFIVLELIHAFFSNGKQERQPLTMPESLPEVNNLPDVIFNKDYFRWKPNNKCAKLPQLRDIVTHNVYWQVLYHHYVPYYLFGAYFDSRGPDIKILAMLTGDPGEALCNIWFNQGIEPKTIKADHHYVWNETWKRKPQLLNPYLFSCKLPSSISLDDEDSIPKAVSLIGGSCDEATNLLKVNYKEDERFNDNRKEKKFMVCVKGLDFPEDISYKLIEWIELIRLLGANKIHFYIFNVHENVAKVLEHYKQVGWIITDGLSIPGVRHHQAYTQRVHSRPQQKRYELIPYNDCFYKHRETYEYIVLLDVDEIIMPNIGDWNDLIAKMHTDSLNASTLSVPNAYFLDEIRPEINNVSGKDWSFFENNTEHYISGHMHILRNLYRTRNITQPSLFIKGFHNTKSIISLHNHFPIECFNTTCKEVKIPESDAKLAHYRRCPKLLGDKCKELEEDFVRDDTVLRFKDNLVDNVQQTIKQIGLD